MLFPLSSMQQILRLLSVPTKRFRFVTLLPKPRLRWLDCYIGWDCCSNSRYCRWNRQSVRICNNSISWPNCSAEGINRRLLDFSSSSTDCIVPDVRMYWVHSRPSPTDSWTIGSSWKAPTGTWWFEGSHRTSPTDVSKRPKPRWLERGTVTWSKYRRFDRQSKGFVFANQKYRNKCDGPGMLSNRALMPCLIRQSQPERVGEYSKEAAELMCELLDATSIIAVQSGMDPDDPHGYSAEVLHSFPAGDWYLILLVPGWFYFRTQATAVGNSSRCC